MDIKMIASDVDRTLLMTDGTLAEETVQAILEAQKRGILITICTGRFPEHVGVLLAERGIVCPVIGINGGTLWDAKSDQVIAHHTMSVETAREVYEVIRQYPARYYVFGRKTLASSLADKRHPSERMFRDVLVNKYGVEFYHGTEGVETVIQKPVSKFIILARDMPEVAVEMHAKLSKIEGVSLTSASLNSIEIVASGVSKGAGVTEMAAAHGIPLENVMAVGDYENDIPMFRIAGTSVAMGNAPDHVRKEAKYMTATNDENGLALAIRRYALGEAV